MLGQSARDQVRRKKGPPTKAARQPSDLGRQATRTAALPCRFRAFVPIATMSLSGHTERGARMPKVRVNYDGWIALFLAVRQRLKPSIGDQLGLELFGEALTLRRSTPTVASPAPEPCAISAAEGSPSAPSPVAQPEPTPEDTCLSRVAARPQSTWRTTQECCCRQRGIIN